MITNASVRRYHGGTVHSRVVALLSAVLMAAGCSGTAAPTDYSASVHVTNRSSQALIARVHLPSGAGVYAFDVPANSEGITAAIIPEDAQGYTTANMTIEILGADCSLLGTFQDRTGLNIEVSAARYVTQSGGGWTHVGKMPSLGLTKTCVTEST